MANRFTLGIEEEFQLVNAQSGELCSCAQSLLDKGEPIFADQIKPEMLLSTLEFITPILPDIASARLELYTARALLSKLAHGEGLALVSAGTHPTGTWLTQERTPRDRYIELENEYQDVGRSLLIFGLHVHVATERPLMITLMNQVRTWLPHLIALSSNSPFWSGRMTGIKAYRTIVWKRFPRSGIPDVFQSWEHFDRYVQDLVDTDCIDNAKKIWWDIRPHPFFDTLEFRVCDMPSTIEDTLAVAALCQALIAKLTQLHERQVDVPVLARDYIEENKWRAMRYGLDAEFIDFAQKRRLSMRDSIRELLEFVDDVVDELGSRREINYIQDLLNDEQGSGADRQIAVYQQHEDAQQVNRFLIEQTMKGVQPDDAILSDKFLYLRSSGAF